MPRAILLFFTALFFASQAGAADPVGFRYLQIPAAPQGRALEAVVWYPAAQGATPTLVGDNPVLSGLPVQVDAPAAAGHRALVLLSHGYGGNWSNQGWLAVELVRQGYVVAAVNHPGTTSKNMNPAIGARLWDRPRDLSRLIDALALDPRSADTLAAGQVAAIGHSLGGWTVMELAGGRFDPDQFDADCTAHAGLAACQVFRALGAGKDAESRTALAQPLKDARIKAVVSLDLGLTGSLNPQSLAAVAVPVLVIAAGEPNPLMQVDLESRRLADQLPPSTTRFTTLPGAAHMSFLPICKPGAAALLAKESPEDAILCLDGEGADREALHRQVVEQIIRFLAVALPPTVK